MGKRGIAGHVTVTRNHRSIGVRVWDLSNALDQILMYLMH
jgi:hypothetical protein